MATQPTVNEIREALLAAGSAHHDYESNHLSGQRDAQWSGWYAAYVLGRLGDFTTPTRLVEWLESTPSGGEWAESAAELVVRNVGTS